jgi:hypothetical protein
MPRYDEAFVERFLVPWNHHHDVAGALALMDRRLRLGSVKGPGTVRRRFHRSSRRER